MESTLVRGSDSVMSVLSTKVYEQTEAEAVEMFERRTRDELGVSAETFLAAYDSGNLPPEWSRESVFRLEMLLPSIR